MTVDEELFDGKVEAEDAAQRPYCFYDMVNLWDRCAED